jgi:sarcosine/dimethylglycine N-methyltransferase
MSSGEMADPVRIAQQYYDSNDADQFYFNVWGGEDIHIGLYEAADDSVRQASLRTVERMALELADFAPGAQILDLGAGYGGAARHLAAHLRHTVTCLNLSQTQNQRNRDKIRAAGLDDRVMVVHGNFEALPFEPRSFDVVWSQDAMLHSGNRRKVLQDVARVLRPGGSFLFTDPMQVDDCPSDVLKAVLARLHLPSLASFAFYRDELARLGFEEVKVVPLNHHVARHYAGVQRELQQQYQRMVKLASQEYVDSMLRGLGSWIDAANAGYLAWGILHFRAP